jgi:hypothetical protein
MIETDAAAFRAAYHLKSELVDFCRREGLPTSGSKSELTERIAVWLETGNVTKPTPARRKAKQAQGDFSAETLIEPDFVCTERHRAFFKEAIGGGFKFNVPFQQWLKQNAGKTYGEAIEAYKEIVRDKKSAPATIGSQFEYNAYIRAFFADNPGRTHRDAIACWKRKKAQPGSHSYSRGDLAAITNHKGDEQT